MPVIQVPRGTLQFTGKIVAPVVEPITIIVPVGTLSIKTTTPSRVNSAEPTSVSLVLEVELSGPGNGWTDISVDWDSRAATIFEYGIRGSTAIDRVASPGRLVFGLKNHAKNSAGLQGRFSPGHANALAGFDVGIGVRVGITHHGITYYKWRGRIDRITPQTGQFRGQITMVHALDWMEEASRVRLRGIPTQTDVRADQVINTIINNMPFPPHSTNIQTGQDTYAYALDNARDEITTPISEFQRIALSEFGQIYVRGDTMDGETFVFENRLHRGRETTNVQVFDNTMQDLTVQRDRDSLINFAQAIAHTRRVDAAATSVLYSLQSTPSLSAGESITLLGPYRDPAQEAARVGGLDMQTPIAGTDYTGNELANGTGEDRTSQLQVVSNFGANGVRFTVTNTGSQTVFITMLQARGKGIYDFVHAVMESDDQASRELHGERPISVDMFYQNDPKIAKELASWFVQVFKDPKSDAVSMTFLANKTGDDMSAALVRDISDRIGIVETVSGVSEASATANVTRGYFINAVKFEITSPGIIRCTWTLTPADEAQYWYLGVPSLSEVGVSTRLGFTIFAIHGDSAHLDTHSDTAHSDVAHDDTHGDTAHSDTHSDTGHADTGHTDSHTDVAHSDVSHSDTHSDVSHSDSPHSDASHQDSHSDVSHKDTHNDTHADTAHTDSHTDNAHTDSHQDFSHEDHGDFIVHLDIPHGDSHSDVSHGDIAHSDVSHTDSHNDTHSDTSHTDSHNDTSHNDVSHNDVSHNDTHGDTNHSDSHSDAHTDTAHTDSGHSDVHGDTAHNDTHTDTNHTDDAHGDSHSDVPHEDVTT